MKSTVFNSREKKLHAHGLYTVYSYSPSMLTLKWVFSKQHTNNVIHEDHKVKKRKIIIMIMIIIIVA